MFRRLPLPLPNGRGSLETGWTPSVQEKYLQLQAETAALEERLRGGLIKGEPVAYKGVHIFQPESAVQQIDYKQDGVSSAPVNFVVRDGQTYDIPIRITGPGVFGAKFIQVSIYKRLFVPPHLRNAISATNQPHEQWVNYLSNIVMTGQFSEEPSDIYQQPLRAFTTKFNLWPWQPAAEVPNNPLTLADWNNSYCAINFFWNLFDGRNNDYYSDEMISHQFLTPKTSVDPHRGFAQDGRLHEFEIPWMFERDANVIFQFRPITPILQFDSSIAGNGPEMGLAFDDRENGRRIETVRVEVELLGTRWITDQDVVQTGALTPTRGSTLVR